LRRSPAADRPGARRPPEGGGRIAASAGLLLASAQGACDRTLSSVDPAGPQAERIDRLTWVFTGLGSAVFLVVVGFLFYALWRGRRRMETAVGADVERRLTWWVAGSVGATALILLVLLVANFATGRALGGFAEPGALSIRITGHQWWWEVEYLDPEPSRRVITANEIHIPVGRRVRLEVGSVDVIHSFWAPNLHGKLDLIPGYRGTTYIRADRAGVYHGRCAEFCGLQHARMEFRIVAESPQRFAAWYEGQIAPAPAPATPQQQAGQQVFLSRSCVLCHTIRGTPAGSQVGPDLTHLASRTTIAAGTLPNTRGHLGGWVLDPQRIKPGAKMPPNQLAADELHALLAYLESLN
jgi:cytochrome c oxidase subunit II